MNPGESHYWESFYSDHGNQVKIQKPSPFAFFLEKFLGSSAERTLLDAGCGNGRDARYFASVGYTVVGVDTASRIADVSGWVFKREDFVSHVKDSYNIVYSRFTLHSIKREDQIAFIDSVRNPGTLLCIECRSRDEHDYYFGKDHYRNPVDANQLQNLVKGRGFDILHFEESNGFAPFGEEDPLCVRLIARRV